MLAFLVGLVEFSRRHALAVVAAALLLSGLGGWYTATHLGVDTDTSNLLSPDLPWQKQSRAFDAGFPQGVNNTTIVVDGSSTDAVASGTSALAAALTRQPDLFKSVRRPDFVPFFNIYGMMFLPVPELTKLSNQLVQAEPLLGPLDADPSLRGLFGVLDQALTGFEENATGAAQIQTPMTRFAATTQALVDGKPASLDWGTLMTGRAAAPEELRQFIAVQPKLDFTALEPGANASAAIRATASRLGLPGMGLRVRLTGDVPLEDEEFASVSEGAGLATGLSLGAVLIILLVGLRAPRIVFSVIVTLIVGLILSATFAALAVGTLNMVSVAFAVLFIGIGVDFGIQFSMRYRAELYEIGSTTPSAPASTNRAALAGAARRIAAPLGLAAAATCVGFYSFLPTDYSGVSELGLIAGTSMIIAVFANLTLLPALLTLLPVRGRAESVGFAWAAPIDDWIDRHAKTIVGVAAILAVAAAASIPLVRFDADPLDLKDPSRESVTTARDLMSDPLSSPYTIEILLPDLKAAEALAGRLSGLPQVKQALTLASFVPDDQPAKLDILQNTALLLGPLLEHSPAAPAPTPVQERASLDSFTQHLARFLAGPKSGELGPAGPQFLGALRHFDAQPGGGDVTALRTALLGGFEPRMDILRQGLQAMPLTVDNMPSDIRSEWIAVNGKARLSVMPTGDMHDPKQMAAFVDAVRALAPEATGAPITILESGRTVSHAFLTASLLAIGGIFLVLLVTLRKLLDVALVLVPLLLAGLYALGACVLLGISFNYANVIAVPLLLGIGVAFDIYFLMAWRQHRAAPAQLQTPTARAVLFSACTTGSAFGMLGISHHVGTASMGHLLVLTLGFVLLSTLIIQPALMSLARSSK